MIKITVTSSCSWSSSTWLVELLSTWLVELLSSAVCSAGKEDHQALVNLNLVLKRSMLNVRQTHLATFTFQTLQIFDRLTILVDEIISELVLIHQSTQHFLKHSDFTTPGFSD